MPAFITILPTLCRPSECDDQSNDDVERPDGNCADPGLPRIEADADDEKYGWNEGNYGDDRNYTPRENSERSPKGHDSGD